MKKNYLYQAVNFSPAGMDMHLFQFQRKEFASNKKTLVKVPEKNLEKYLIYYVDVQFIHTFTRGTLLRHGADP